MWKSSRLLRSTCLAAPEQAGQGSRCRILEGVEEGIQNHLPRRGQLVGEGEASTTPGIKQLVPMVQKSPRRSFWRGALVVSASEEERETEDCERVKSQVIDPCCLPLVSTPFGRPPFELPPAFHHVSLQPSPTSHLIYHLLSLYHLLQSLVCFLSNQHSAQPFC